MSGQGNHCGRRGYWHSALPASEKVARHRLKPVPLKKSMGISVPTLPKKIRRRRPAGELSVEQTHDMASVAAMLERAGIAHCTSASTSGCVLVGYCGNDPAGGVCLETQVE